MLVPKPFQAETTMMVSSAVLAWPRKCTGLSSRPERTRMVLTTPLNGEKMYVMTMPTMAVVVTTGKKKITR